MPIFRLGKKRGAPRTEEYTLFKPGRDVLGITEALLRAKVTKLVPNPETWRRLETYSVENPFSTIRPTIEIWEEEKTGRRMYVVREPLLNPKELAVYREIQSIFTYTDLGIEDYTDRAKVMAEARRRLSELVAKYCASRGEGIDPEKIRYYVMRDVLGYSVIDPIMRDPNVEDISCSGPGRKIYVWHRFYEYIETNIVLSAEALDALIIKFANMAGKHISTANPVLDAILPGGHRIAATFRREVSTRGTTFTIRKFREDPITIVDMVSWNTLPREMAAYLWTMMEHRKCGLILGVTGAGKSVSGSMMLPAVVNGVLGIYTMDEVWAEISQRAVSVGDAEVVFDPPILVRTVDPETLETRWVRPRAIMRHRCDRRMLRVYLRSGRYIDVTEDHSIMVLDNGSLVPTNPGQHLVGKKVVVPIGPATVCGDAESRSLGIAEAVADIHIFVVKTPEIESLIDEAVKRVGRSKALKILGYSSPHSIKASIRIDRLISIARAAGIELPERFSIKSRLGNPLPITIVARPEFARLLGIVASSGTHNRNCVYVAPRAAERALELCRALGDEDECRLVSKNVLVIGGTLAAVIRSMLRNRVPKIPALGGYWVKELVEGMLEGGEDCGEAVGIRVWSYRDAVAISTLLTVAGLPSYIGISTHSGRRRIVVYVPKRAIESWRRGEVPGAMIDEVVGVEEIPIEDYVYDLEVPETQTFEANNVVVHNTSTLNALATMLKPSMKVVTIEDTPELKLPLENWVQLVSRPSYGVGPEKIGEVTLFDLVKIALRYRPDVIIVGEIRGEEAYVLFQAMASVSRDTPILIKDREGRVQLVKIGDFVDMFYSDPNEEWVPKEIDGYWVLSHDGYRAVWKPIKYVLRHRASEVYRIEIEGGGTIRATASHSVFVLDPETLDIKVKEVKDLKPGDLLVTFVKRGTGDGNTQRDPVLGDIDGDLAFAMGLYLADGCVKEHRGSRIAISVGASKYGMAERVADTMRSKFMTLPAVDNRGSYKIYEFCNTVIAKRFGELLGRRLAEKRVPPQIWSSPRDVVREFLEGYSADSRRTLRRRYRVYTTVNRDLAVELIWLTRLNGWYSSLFRESGSGKNAGKTYYTVAVYLDEGREPRKPNAAERVPSRALVKLFELAGISMPLELTRLRKRAFVSVKTARKVIEYVKRSGKLSEEVRRLIERIETYISGDLRAVKVKRVERESYNDFVYDLSVPGTESFFGGDVPVLLHNTGHGGMTTMHAENIDAAVKRLTSPPMNIPPSYVPLVNFALVIKRVELEHRIVRRITDLWEVVDYNKYPKIAEWDARTDSWRIDLSRSEMLRNIARFRGWDMDYVLNVDLPAKMCLLQYLVLTGQRDYRTVANHVYSFYKDPVAKLREIFSECVKRSTIRSFNRLRVEVDRVLDEIRR